MEENTNPENVAVSNDAPQQEKMLSQSEVNKIVGREKAEAAANARRAVEQEYAARESLPNPAQMQPQAPTARQIGEQQQSRNSNVSRDMDADAIYQQVTERFNAEQKQKDDEIAREQFEQDMTQVARNYTSKMSDGPKNYSDFDEVIKDFDPTAFPQLIYLTAGMENADGIMYELVKNPSKLVSMNALAQTSPKMAHAELLKLSGSIGSNRQAQSQAQHQNVDAPLDRLEPSRVSGSSDKMSIGDLRNQPWLRG